MGMFVFLLVVLFWVGAFAAAKTGIGIGIATALAMILGMIGSTIGSGIPAQHFLIAIVGLLAVSALATGAMGLGRAANGESGAWTMFSWSVSLASFPLVASRSFDTLIKAWP